MVGWEGDLGEKQNVKSVHILLGVTEYNWKPRHKWVFQKVVGLLFVLFPKFPHKNAGKKKLHFREGGAIAQ